MNVQELLPTPSPTSTYQPPPKGRLWWPILAGLLLWAANPPLGLWPLAWFAIAPLIVSVLQASHIRQALWRGYLFGWFFLGPVWYWTGLTVTAWTGSPIGWLAWFGLTLILACFYALWAGAAWWLDRHVPEPWAVTALAAAWTVMEWARTLGPLSMPWAQLSYTQTHFLPILQIADTTGAYGVSFLILLVNGAFAYFLMGRDHPQRARRLWAACTLTFMVSLYGIARMQQPEGGTPIEVATLQTNISSYTMLSPQEQLQRIRSLVIQASQHTPPAQLDVLPESASPHDPIHNPQTYLFFQNLTNHVHAAILTGAQVHHNGQNHNSSVLFIPNAPMPISYNKQQLVPFGEFIPFRTILSPMFGRLFDFPPDDVTPGAHPRVLRAPLPNGTTLEVGPFICYESMYPARVRSMTQDGASILATISNDSWFLSRAAMEQHLAAVVLRAIENRRQVVRATTTGISCLLDSYGRTTTRLPVNRQGVAVGRMLLLNGKTPYVRYGDWFVMLCILAIATLLLLQAIAQHRTSSNGKTAEL